MSNKLDEDFFDEEEKQIDFIENGDDWGDDYELGKNEIKINNEKKKKKEQKNEQITEQIDEKQKKINELKEKLRLKKEKKKNEQKEEKVVKLTNNQLLKENNINNNNEEDNINDKFIINENEEDQELKLKNEKEEKLKKLREELKRKREKKNEIQDPKSPKESKEMEKKPQKVVNLKVAKQKNKKIKLQNQNEDIDQNLELKNKKIIEDSIPLEPVKKDSKINLQKKETKKNSVKKKKSIDENEKIVYEEELNKQIKEKKKKKKKKEEKSEKLNENLEEIIDENIEEKIDDEDNNKTKDKDDEFYFDNLADIKDITMNDKYFLINPLKNKKMVQTTIVREKKLFKNTKYHMYFIEYDHDTQEVINKHYLVSAKKMSGNVSSNYLISMDRNNFDRKHDSCLAKLRSNIVGTEFSLFDKGENPKKKPNIDNTLIRNQLGYIQYEKNILGSNGPRKFTMIFPKYKDGKFNIIKPLSKNDNIKGMLEAGNTKDLNIFVNKSPIWNEEYQSFVLNFYGRVDVASIKNFQLIKKPKNENDEQNITLQFGKIGENEFNLDFTYPFSPVQAFAIALSSCDNKLFCE